MAESDGPIMVYSIQRTYILNAVLKPKKNIVTCDERIDIPTIEPLLPMPEGYTEITTIVLPCIELVGNFLSQLDLTFETNEGITVLPVKIPKEESPYGNFRYVLVLPRGATGVKSCRVIHKALGFEVQHNFTFGIMPPPYNYDNAVISFLSAKLQDIANDVTNLDARVTALENKAGG